MSEFSAAVYAEYLKVRRSKILWLTIGALCLAPIFGSLFVVVLRNPNLAAGNGALTAKAALTGFSADWSSFFNLMAQAVGIGGLVVFGFIGAWLFGREYSDHTLKDLLVLPIPRWKLVTAKAIVCLGWCLTVSIAVTIVSLVTGALLGLPGWDPQLLLSSLGHVALTALLAAALCPPVFFVASAGRGYLGALGFVVLTVVFSQIIGALGYGAYVPWAVPALYSGIGSEVGGSLSPLSYLLVVFTGLIGFIGTILWWNYADQTD